MKYEYLTTSKMYFDEKYLNKYGSEGWELVQIIEGKGRCTPDTPDTYIWKRQLKPTTRVAKKF